MASIYEQVKTAQVNSFTGGMNTDLHPMVQPSDTMTDCVNGTLITYQGNENIIQNDMGNYELKNAKLPEGYIPLGMKEHNGIIYIVSTNPITGKTQIGSYPSPQTLVKDGDPIERNIEEIEIKAIETWDPKNPVDLLDPKYLESNGYTALTNRAESIVFSDIFDEITQITNNDKYQLVQKSDNSDDSKFQYGQYFILDSDNKVTNIDPPKIVENFNEDSDQIKTNVSWDIPGWLGFKHKLYTPKKHIQNINGSILKVISKTNYSIIDNKLEYNGTDTYRFGVSVDPGYTLDFADVCKLVKDNEIWVKSIDNTQIYQYANYLVNLHNYDNNEGTITFNDVLHDQPNLFLEKGVTSIDYASTIHNVNLYFPFLDDVDTLIVGPDITDIVIRRNKNLKIIIRGHLNNQVTIRSVVDKQLPWDPNTKINISCSDSSKILEAEYLQESVTKTEDQPEEYKDDRIENYIKYISSNKISICLGVVRDNNYFHRFVYENPITNIFGIFNESYPPVEYDSIDTIILPESVNTGLGFFGDNSYLNNVKVYYSSQFAGKYYDGSTNAGVTYYDYYTHCHYIAAATEDQGEVISEFDTFITSKVKKQVNNDGIIGWFITTMEALSITSGDPQVCYFNIKDIGKNVQALEFWFNQYYIRDGVLYNIIEINGGSSQLLVELHPSGSNILTIVPNIDKKKTTGNSFNISNTLYNCPIVPDLELGIFYKIIGSNSNTPLQKVVFRGTLSTNYSVSVVIDNGELEDINLDTEYILAESVPFYQFGNKLLILDNLKETDKITLITQDPQNTSIKRFQYQISNDKVIRVTLELNQVISGSYTARLYQFHNGKLLDNVSNPVKFDVNWSDIISDIEFTLTDTNIPFFIFSVDDLYKGIIVNNTDKVNNSDNSLMYDDYNLIPNILKFQGAPEEKYVYNPRIVYMYIPDGVVSSETDKENNKLYSIASDKCSLITYYNKPWILTKDEILNVKYLGVGVIGDITIDSELLMGMSINIPYRINSNTQLLNSSNVYTVLCAYTIFPFNTEEKNEPTYNYYLSREYLIKSTYSPFTLMKKEENIKDEKDSGLNYNLTPELIQYADWGQTDLKSANKIINIEKQSGLNVDTHIEAISNFEGLTDNVKGDSYSTNFTNLLSQLNKKQLFYFFNCAIKTKDNGLVVPFPLMFRDSALWYWDDHIDRIKNTPAENGLLALTATRKSEWLKSSSFIDDFKNRGLTNANRVLATIGVAIGSAAAVAGGGALLWVASALIAFGAATGGIGLVALAATAIAGAVIGLFVWLIKAKLKDRYFTFIGLRYDGDGDHDKAPFIIPMWGYRRGLRSYMLTESEFVERAEQRMMAFCKNVYYLNTEEFNNNRISIPNIDGVKCINITNKIEVKITNPKGPINILYEGVYWSNLPNVLSDLIGHANNNVQTVDSILNIKFTISKDTLPNLEEPLDLLKKCIKIQTSIYDESKIPEKGFYLDDSAGWWNNKDAEGNLKYNTIKESINSVLSQLSVTDDGRWYFKYADKDFNNIDFNHCAFQGNRGRDWTTINAYINKIREYKKVHAGEAVTDEDGWAPIARPCNPTELKKLDKDGNGTVIDSFMVPDEVNNGNSTSWKLWEEVSQLEAPEYLQFLTNIYGTKKL